MTDATTAPAETQRARRGHDFYPDPGQLPPLYATQGTATADTNIQVHYVAGGCYWWLVEYDPTQGLAYGYACLGDPTNAEWGYLHLPELEAVSVDHGLVVVERDLGWTPRRVRDLDLPGHPTR